jgi:DUF1680 family protein
MLGFSSDGRIQAHDAVIVDNRLSRLGRLHPLSLMDVRLQDAFWQPRREMNRTITLPYQYQQSEETNRLNNFRRVAGTYDGPFEGIYFNDSDVYKWAEAVAWTLATDYDPQLDQQLDEVIAIIAAAQDENGYLNTYYSLERKDQRWSNIKDMHELYCAGHLFQAAVAHHRATGKTSLLNVATRYADHIDRTFGPNGRPGACGHPEIEMALIELARDTREQRYLELAHFFIEQRGQQPPTISGSEYMQDHQPVREQTEVVGHAVRALYLYSGVTDLYTETGDETWDKAQETLWHNLVEQKTYITGGVGSRWEGEAFGADYELPNRRAYTETCAAIASVMWNWRLLLLKGEARFADAIENALYNGVISGISLDGRQYFYQNPLADRGKHRRSPWFGCACCPPNIARLLASLPGYFYSTSKEGLWVHLYASGMATAALEHGQKVTLEQHTEYPWDGTIELHIDVEQPATFSVFLRIPAWTQGAQIQVNGEQAGVVAQPGSYAEIRREWKAGDTIRLELPMEVQLVESHPFVQNNHDRVAIVRGPLVYCVEQADHGDVDVWNLVLSTDGGANWEWQKEDNLLGGVVTIHTSAYARSLEGWQHQLYKPYDSVKPVYKPVQLKAIPYYAWANREAGPMQVWLPIEDGLK